MDLYNLVSFLAWAVLLLFYIAICVGGMVKLWSTAPDADAPLAESRALRSFADDPYRLAQRCGLSCADCGNPFMVLGGSVWCGTCDPPPAEVLERLQPGTLAKRRARRAARRAA